MLVAMVASVRVGQPSLSSVMGMDEESIIDSSFPDHIYGPRRG